MLSDPSIVLDLLVEADGAAFLYAEPFDTRHQRFLGFEVERGAIEGSVANQFGGQRALLVRPSSKDPVRLRFRFEAVPSMPPAWLKAPMPTSWLAPSAALADEIRAAVAGTSPPEIVNEVVAHAAQRFEYGHPEQHFGTGEDALPALACDLSLGSCVDIHSYTIAALAVFEIPATYLAGVYCEGEASGHSEACIPGHCWMESHAGETLDWDIAHVLKYGLPLPVPAVLNPRPGRRIAIQSGRGHRFDLPTGPILVDRIHKPTISEGDRAGEVLPFTASINWPQSIRSAA
jgi:transglutaminase-like putative cysteine protease